MILALGVMLAYIPNYTGAVINTGWVWLLIVTPILLLRCEIRSSPAYEWGMIFMIYAALSLFWSPHGLWAFLQLCALASVFIWATNQPDLRKVSIGLAIGLGVSGILAIFQWCGFNGIFVITPFPAGLFINENVFAEISALVLVLLLVNRLWWWIPVTIPGLLIGSRASIIALLCVFIAWVWSRSKLAGAAIGGTLGALTAYSVTTFHESSIDQRWALWADTWSGVTVWGRGIGSFEYLYPYFANHVDTLAERPTFAHNDILQLMFELGVGIIPLFIAIWYTIEAKDNHRYVLLCFGIIGLFGFPLHIPAEAFIFAVVSGYLANLSDKLWIARVYSRPALPWLDLTG